MPKSYAVMEGHVDLSGLCCHQGHGDIWAYVAARGHVWVLGPVAVRSVLMSETRLLPKAMQMSLV